MTSIKKALRKKKVKVKAWGIFHQKSLLVNDTKQTIFHTRREAKKNAHDWNTIQKVEISYVPPSNY